MPFCECACLCFSTAAKLFPQIVSSRSERRKSRKCLLPWRSVNVMSRQTLPSDTWQRALLLSGPPCECADARACVHVRVSVPAPLMRRFLRLFVFSQTGRLNLHRGLMGEKLRRPHKALPTLTRSLSSFVFETSLDLCITKYHSSERQDFDKCGTHYRNK